MKTNRKPFVRTLLCALALTASVASEAADTLTVARGDYARLTAPAGYTAYQWQVSTNGGKSYVALPGKTAQSDSVAAFVPALYRAAATTTAGATEYVGEQFVQLEQLSFKSNEYTAPASHGYVETLDGPRSGSPDCYAAGGITIPGATLDSDGLPTYTAQLTNWTSLKSQAVYYFHHPRATVTTSMVLTATRNKNVAFRLRVYNPSDLEVPIAETYLTVTGTGKADTVDVVSLKLPSARYFRYELCCLSGNSYISNIDRFLFHSTSTTKSYVANYLSSPSVHLSNWHSTKTGAPTGSVFDWCYQEIMIPEESDIVGTYAMALGVLKGYMGIQNDGTLSDGQTNHRVLFSMWDDGDTESNPDLPDNLRAGAVDWSDEANVNRFGGEGTGVQCYFTGHRWECGTFVQFLTNSRIEEATYTTTEDGVEVTKTQTNTLVTAWFNAQDGKGWQYIATTRLPNGSQLFNTWYSFLEDYNWPTGEALRKAYYRNSYAHHAASGKWYQMNAADFSHTDGGTNTGARTDYGQGLTTDFDNCLFMQTGGYLPTVTKAKNHKLSSDATPVDTINLDTMLARVDQAIEAEKARLAEDALFTDNVYDKTGWEVISYSSQETSGEGTNGRAAQVIDGDADTYWHSQWQSKKAQYPHTIVVDTHEEIPVAGFQIEQFKSSSYTRCMKAFDLYTSLDNETWTKAYTTEEAEDAATLRVLFDQPDTLRYFKLVIRSGHATEGPFVRISEIDLAYPSAATAIHSATTSTATDATPLDVHYSAATQSIVVTSPVTAATARLAIYDVTGRRLFDRNVSHLSAGTTFDVPVTLKSAAPIVVALTAEGRTYGRVIKE